MKINLGNKLLFIGKSGISREPNIKKLEKELSRFFENHKVEGANIDVFGVMQNNLKTYVIYPSKPFLKGHIIKGSNTCEEIKIIGQKYGIPCLEFCEEAYI